MPLKVTGVYNHYDIMKKLFFLSIVLGIAVFGCRPGNRESEKKTVASFVEEVIAKDTVTVHTLRSFIEVYPEYDQQPDKDKKLQQDWVYYFIAMYHDTLEKDKFLYDIVSHKAVSAYDELVEDQLYKHLSYPGLDQVFYVTSEDHTRIYFPVVVEQHKVISFFPHLHSGAEAEIRPYLLNHKDGKKDK